MKQRKLSAASSRAELIASYGSTDESKTLRRAPSAAALVAAGYKPEYDDEPVSVKYPDGTWHPAFVQMVGPGGDVAVASVEGGPAEWLFAEADVEKGSDGGTDVDDEQIRRAIDSAIRLQEADPDGDSDPNDAKVMEAL